MSLDHQALLSHPLLSDRYRLSLEHLVSEHLRRAWVMKVFRDLHDLACHPAAILSDGAFSVFAKLSTAAHALDQFEVELAGLRYLADRAGVLTPPLIGVLEVDGGVILVMEAVEEVARETSHWREIGRTLARIHQVKGETFGFERQGYFGPLYQDNRPMPDWLAFFAERRLWHFLISAIDSGNLPTELIRQVEKLITRLPALEIPPVQPCLLHGDAQQNNYISTPQGAVVIDPAVYYGNPEIDLAYLDYFQPVPPEVFSAYQEILPIAPGFSERRALWRIPGYLAAVAVEGAAYLPLLSNAVQPYL